MFNHLFLLYPLFFSYFISCKPYHILLSCTSLSIKRPLTEIKQHFNFSFRRSASLISKVFETKNLQRIIFSSYCCVFFVLQCFAVVFFCFSFGFHIIGIVVIIFEIEVSSTLILLERFLIILFPFCFLLCSLAFLLLLFGSALAPFSLCFFFFFFSFELKTSDGLPSGKLKGRGGARSRRGGCRACSRCDVTPARTPRC